VQTSHGGDEVVYRGRRGDEEMTWSVTYGTLPLESGEGIDVIYGEVASPAGYKLRSVLTLPADVAAPAPVLFYLQGITCSFAEWPGEEGPPPRQFLHDLSRAGWATYRVEKRGIGDSQGAPCTQMDFETEGADYIAALETLKGDPRVDADRIVLFGHSMGGAFGPWMARSEPVAGIIVYGTSAANWLEYMIRNVRRQVQLGGATYAEATQQLNDMMPFYSALFVDHLSPDEIRAQRPAAAAVMDQAFDSPDTMQTRHYTFYHQLSSYNMAAWWAEVAVPVLVMRGTADFITARDEHEAIAEAVNAAHPGMARFVEVDRADHIFATFESELESMQNGLRGPYNPAVGEAVQEWLNERWPTEASE
jgi:pimeloyl-ACP methyl ester carboxylesterase